MAEHRSEFLLDCAQQVDYYDEDTNYIESGVCGPEITHQLPECYASRHDRNSLGHVIGSIFDDTRGHVILGVPLLAIHHNGYLKLHTVNVALRSVSPEVGVLEMANCVFEDGEIRRTFEPFGAWAQGMARLDVQEALLDYVEGTNAGSWLRCRGKHHRLEHSAVTVFTALTQTRPTHLLTYMKMHDGFCPFCVDQQVQVLQQWDSFNSARNPLPKVLTWAVQPVPTA